MVDLTVNLAGLEMDNPVVPASGTFGFGKEFKDIYDINILGSFSFKGTTKDARFGNPTPRIAECTSGMINAVGLQNPGVHHVIEHELPEMKEYFHKPVIANVSGFSVDDYAYTCSLLDKEEQVGILEVNVSCPNVHGYLCKCFFHFFFGREIQESSRRGRQNEQYRCRSRHTEEQNPTTMLASHRNFLRELFPKAIPYTHPGISETRAKQIGYFIIFFLHDFYTL